VRALTVKKEITRLRQALEQQYDVGAMTELENECRAKELQIAKVEEAIKQIKKVGMNH
jgi:hypothetical protein